MNSILDSVKKLLGIVPEYTQFDADIIMHINTVFMILSQIGIGPENGFSICDMSSYWEQYLQDDKMLEPVKTYMYMRVRKMFDPPQSSAAMEALNKTIDELEWRLYVYADSKKEVA